MTVWTSQEIAEALGISVPPAQSFGAVSTDTRTLQPGALFVALAGEKFDGHAYLAEARDAGAVGAIVSRGTPRIAGLTLFEVDDTLIAYGHLGRYRRRSLSGPVVAVTGTNGKTSTKEMMLALMRTRWKTHATRSNNNNRVGVPLTILEAPNDTEALVVEAGANERGEISMLRQIIEPSVSIVTNVAAGHLEGFESIDGVLEEKTALLAGVPKGVVGEQPPVLPLRARELCPEVLVAGFTAEAQVRPETWELDTHGCGDFVYHGERIHLNVPGEHQIANALLALGAARCLNLECDFATALRTVKLPGGRCEVVEHGECTIVNDTYNANPASLLAALRLAETLRGDRKLIVVVGSMLELGQNTKQLHRDSAEAIMAIQPDLIGATGDFVDPLRQLNAGSLSTLVTADDVVALGGALRGHLEGGELVLLKASRGVGLERIIPFLAQN